MYAQGLSIGKAARVFSRNRRGCVKNTRGIRLFTLVSHFRRLIGTQITICRDSTYADAEKLNM